MVWTDYYKYTEDNIIVNGPVNKRPRFLLLRRRRWWRLLLITETLKRLCRFCAAFWSNSRTSDVLLQSTYSSHSPSPSRSIEQPRLCTASIVNASGGWCGECRTEDLCEGESRCPGNKKLRKLTKNKVFAMLNSNAREFWFSRPPFKSSSSRSSYQPAGAASISWLQRKRRRVVV